MDKFTPTFENSPEKQAENFNNRLDNIFNAQLTVENIQDFTDNAMNKLIKLIDEVKSAYQKENSEQLTGKELEDKAFEHYNLRGIIKLLDKIQEKSEQIAEIYQYIKEIPQIDEVITPPDKLDLTKTTNGDIPWERKKIIPRLATLLYILETDFNIPKEEVNIIEGIVSNEQLRTEPYYRVEINELNRLIYVCIEAENVTYIFDQEKLKENRIEVELMDILTKQERNDALEQYPNLGTKLRQSKYWRENISDLLTAEKLEYKTAPTVEKTTTNDENIPQVSTSEFDEWRGFWTDEEGEHWGSINSLKIKIGLSQAKTIEYAKILISRQVKDLKGTIRTGYCYEDLIQIPEIKKLINTPSVDMGDNSEKKQWKGFWTDENGKHWAPINTLADFIYLSYKTISPQIKTLSSKEIKDMCGKFRPAYCYEDLIQIPEIKKLINTPNVATKDNLEKKQWDGFWTDENDNHWGHRKSLFKRIHLHQRTVTTIINTEKLTQKDIKDKTGKILPAYCYEDVIQIPEIQELLRKKGKTNQNS